MTNNHSKGRAIALLPIAVFLLFFIGSGLITGDCRLFNCFNYSLPAKQKSKLCTEAAPCFYRRR